MIYLLDTNFCIACLRGHDLARRKLAGNRPDDCGVSMIALYELYAGVYRCSDPLGESKKIEEFLAPLHLLSFDWDAARRSAFVRCTLERVGRLIGPYDIQLAGHALSLDVTLVSRNTKEFARVPGLRVENWEG